MKFDDSDGAERQSAHREISRQPSVADCTLYLYGVCVCTPLRIELGDKLIAFVTNSALL